MWYNLNEMRFMNNKLENIIKTEVYLKDISTIIMGQSPKSIYYNDKGQGKFLIQGNADIKNRITTPRSYSSEGTKTCNDGDIIMSVRAPVGSVAKANGHYFIGRGVCAIRSDINEYIYQYLLWHESMWEQFCTGSTFDSITSDIIRNMNIPLHNKSLIDEYSKLLSTMDKLIEDKESLIKNIQNEKKKLHHRIFERTENSNECKIKLNDVASIISHQSLSKFISDDQNGYKIIDMGAISSDGRIISTKYTDRKIQALEIGDLVMVKDDIGGGNIIGATVYIDDTNCVCGDHVYRIIINNEFCSSYVQKVINSPSIRKQLRSKANGTAQLGLGKKAVEDVLIPVIPLNEQEKIANLLSSMDKIIDLHKQELEQLKLKKKYYLNKIFN
jgi:type I restriction enzyme S subunit